MPWPRRRAATASVISRLFSASTTRLGATSRTRRHDRARVGEAQDGALVPVAERRQLDVDVGGLHFGFIRTSAERGGRGAIAKASLNSSTPDAAREGEGRVDVDRGARRETIGDDARDQAAERVAHDDVRAATTARGSSGLDHVIRPRRRRVAVRPRALAVPGEVDGEDAEALLDELAADPMPRPMVGHDAVDEDGGPRSGTGLMDGKLHVGDGTQPAWGGAPDRLCERLD